MIRHTIKHQNKHFYHIYFIHAQMQDFNAQILIQYTYSNYNYIYLYIGHNQKDPELIDS